jgi:uncharacterized damage-inducible protein DinB
MTDFPRLFAYDDWANRETLASLERARRPPDAARRRMAHVLADERLWLARLTGDPQRVVVWPDWTLADCRFRLAELPALWADYLASLDEPRRRAPVAYVNSKGESWESLPEDVLLHVLLHSGQHRGQIAADLRAAGEEPAYTDYIEAVRRGKL